MQTCLALVSQSAPLAGVPEVGAQVVAPQACAAQQAVLYARPAGHGSAYGRVGSEQVQRCASCAVGSDNYAGSLFLILLLQDAPAFARPSKYTPAEDLKLSQLSSAAAATDTWKPQVVIIASCCEVRMPETVMC